MLRPPAELACRVQDLPRERLARFGAIALRNEELLAIVLGTGVKGKGVIDVAKAVLLMVSTGLTRNNGLSSLEDLRGLGRAKVGYPRGSL